MKVKVYNMKEMVERRTNNKRTPREDKLAIIEENHVIIVIDNEAVHTIYGNLESTHEVQLHDVLKNGNMDLIPACHSNLPISYIKQHAKCEEVELTDFVRRFGTRIESNYMVLLETIKDAGLNPDDYKRSK